MGGRHLGEKGLVKEIQIKIDKKGTVSGFMDLVGKGTIKLEGKIDFFNEKEIRGVFESTELKKGDLPVTLQVKTKNTIRETENVWPPDDSIKRWETPKEYLKLFNNTQTLKGFFSIGGTKGVAVGIKASSKQDAGWDAYIEWDNIKTLKSKNVPGLNNQMKKDEIKKKAKNRG